MLPLADGERLEGAAGLQVDADRGRAAAVDRLAVDDELGVAGDPADGLGDAVDLADPLEDATKMLQLLPRSGTSQKLTSYVSFITGPSRSADIEMKDVSSSRSQTRIEKSSLTVITCSPSGLNRADVTGPSCPS